VPELPEVETVAKAIRPHFLGNLICDVRIHDAKLMKFPISNVLGQTISKIQRRGKYLLFWLANSGDWGIALHLRMSGKLLMTNQFKKEKHIRLHLITQPQDSSQTNILAFYDVRRLGTFEWKNFAKLEQKMGIEPLSSKFSPTMLQQLLKNTHQPIKSFLLNQKKIAGIGNIYASEALFRSQIHPLRNAASLTLSEIEKLANNIQAVLFQAIENQGTSIHDFMFGNGNGQEGNFQHFLQVYGKHSQPCPICGTPIQRIKINGRSSFFCPSCQHISKNPEIG